MNRRSYTEEQIMSILNEADSDVPVKELDRQHGMAPASFYPSKRRYGGMERASGWPWRGSVRSGTQPS
ncbi:MAG: transposase [Myxococcales bacterium FL481]|nr:MAG: transposase [Myxococcales bacterium FL481]